MKTPKTLLEFISEIKKKPIMIDSKYEHIKKAHLFYSQQFKPDLIPILLDGWQEEQPGKYWRDDNQIIFDEVGGTYTIYVGFFKTIRKFYIPITVDQFMGDCQRAELPADVSRVVKSQVESV